MNIHHNMYISVCQLEKMGQKSSSTGSATRLSAPPPTPWQLHRAIKWKGNYTNCFVFSCCAKCISSSFFLFQCHAMENETLSIGPKSSLKWMTWGNLGEGIYMKSKLEFQLHFLGVSIRVLRFQPVTCTSDDSSLTGHEEIDCSSEVSF